MKSIDNGIADKKQTVKDHKRKHDDDNDDDDEDPSARPNQELIEDPIAEVEMDDPVNTTAEDVAPDADQPHDDSTQANDKAPKQDWFKQPPRTPTPDPK
ncbi:hypothetical protein Tco_1254761 [Tanacetum coccineum]